MNENHVYDMIIVGGGPGGYTSALYAARAGFDTIVLEKLSAGGQMSLTWQIDNYPGFENGIDGFSLAEKMQKQAEKFGAKSEYAEVFNMDLTGKLKRVETSSGIYIGKTVVITTGANPRELGLAKEKELIGISVGAANELVTETIEVFARFWVGHIGRIRAHLSHDLGA